MSPPVDLNHNISLTNTYLASDIASDIPQEEHTSFTHDDEITVLDGGLGTTLTRPPHNVVFSAATPLWSSHLLLSPDARGTLRKCHAAFSRHADMIMTATYQASREGFARTCTREFPAGVTSLEDVTRFLEHAVDLAVRAATAGHEEGGHRGGGLFHLGPGRQRRPRRRDVVLCLGPYGACMIPCQEYSGRYDDAHDSVEALRKWHLDRLALFLPLASFIGREVRCLAFETVPRVDEIIAIRQAVDAAVDLGLPRLPYWISCVFPGNEGTRLPGGGNGSNGGSSGGGGTARDAVVAMLDPTLARSRPWGVGLNCTPVGKVGSLLVEFEDAVGEVVMKTGGQLSWPALVVYPDGTRDEIHRADGLASDSSSTTTTTAARVASNTTSAGPRKLRKPHPKPSKVKPSKSNLKLDSNKMEQERTPRQPMEEWLEGNEGNAWTQELLKAVLESRSRTRAMWEQIVVGGCCQVEPGDIGRLKQCLSTIPSTPKKLNL